MRYRCRSRLENACRPMRITYRNNSNPANETKLRESISGENITFFIGHDSGNLDAFKMGLNIWYSYLKKSQVFLLTENWVGTNLFLVHFISLNSICKRSSIDIILVRTVTNLETPRNVFFHSVIYEICKLSISFVRE